jgi:phosphoenolpyruvate carboxylase
MAKHDPSFFLDFLTTVPELPSWCIEGLRVCVGMGDYVMPFKGKEMPNTEAYPDYDVYVIFTGYNEYAPELNIEANIEAIRSSKDPNRLICDIDLENRKQVDIFTELFRHKVDYINHINAKPRILPEDAMKLLDPDGERRVDIQPGWSVDYYNVYQTNKNFKHQSQGFKLRSKGIDHVLEGIQALSKKERTRENIQRLHQAIDDLASGGKRTRKRVSSLSRSRMMRSFLPR